MDDYDEIEEGYRSEYAELLADREVLQEVSRELVEARVALRVVATGLSPRVKQSLREGAGWVRLSRSAAIELLKAVDDA